MGWDSVKDILVTWVLPAIAGYMAKQMRMIVKTFKSMNHSVTELNIKMAKVVFHIENHESRLVHLESQKRKRRK